MLDIILERFNYIPIIILMMTGLYVVIATGNLVKRLVGLSLFQTSVFLLYITIGKVFGDQPPILDGAHHGDDEGGHGAGYGATGYGEAGDHGEGHGDDYAAGDAHAGDHGEAVADAAEHASDYAHGADAVHHASEVLYSNPLPHVLILTAIVVSVSITAVALAIVINIHQAYGTVESDEIIAEDAARGGDV